MRVFRFGTPAVTVGLACVFVLGCGGKEVRETGRLEPPLQSELVQSELVTAADWPAKLAVAPDGRLFYSEYQSGNIRIISAEGQLLEQPFAHVDVGVGPGGERRDWGLFGLAFDPEFETNHYVYAYFIAPTPDGPGQATLMRFTDVDNRGTDPTPILADLPQISPDQNHHTGGGLLFGPDGYLYLSLGDFSKEIALKVPQDLSLLPGKILRVNTDGSAPPDNPFVDTPDADPRIFAYGFRNVYDFTFHPITGRTYANDNGISNCDELNIVDKGQNYGWPQSLDEEVCHNPNAVEPIYLHSVSGKKPEENGSNVGPTAIEFLTDSGDLLLTCESVTGFMQLLVLEGPDYDVVRDTRVIAEDCRLDIARAPDGTIYYSDFGEIRSTNLGEIRRIVPE